MIMICAAQLVTIIHMALAVPLELKKLTEFAAPMATSLLEKPVAQLIYLTSLMENVLMTVSSLETNIVLIQLQVLINVNLAVETKKNVQTLSPMENATIQVNVALSHSFIAKSTDNSIVKINQNAASIKVDVGMNSPSIVSYQLMAFLISSIIHSQSSQQRERTQPQFLDVAMQETNTTAAHKDITLISPKTQLSVSLNAHVTDVANTAAAMN